MVFSQLVDNVRVFGEHIDRHGEHAFLSADNFIFAEKLNVSGGAPLFEFCPDSGCAHVDNAFRARNKPVSGLNRKLDGQRADSSGNVFS